MTTYSSSPIRALRSESSDGGSGRPIKFRYVFGTSDPFSPATPTSRPGTKSPCRPGSGPTSLTFTSETDLSAAGWSIAPVLTVPPSTPRFMEPVVPDARKRKRPRRPGMVLFPVELPSQGGLGLLPSLPVLPVLPSREGSASPTPLPSSFRDGCDDLASMILSDLRSESSVQYAYESPRSLFGEEPQSPIPVPATSSPYASLVERRASASPHVALGDWIYMDALEGTQ